MCKLAFARTSDGTAYKKVISMLQHQENVVAGHSTGILYSDNSGLHVRKAIGKIINFLAEYPDTPRTNMALGHSRYATVGEINIQNQHPMGILYKGKRIGYAIHNGTWQAHVNYEHYRNNNRVNNTDSALMVTIYGMILEKYGDTPNNRRRALATLQDFLQKTGAPRQNFIFYFDDDQTIFNGMKLTYTQQEDSIGVMTFGFQKDAEPERLYEVKGTTLRKYALQPFSSFSLEAKPPKQPSRTSVVSCQLSSQESQKTIKEFIRLDKKKWRLAKLKFASQEQAQLFGELEKKKSGLKYRTVQQPDGSWSVYIRRKRR